MSEENQDSAENDVDNAENTIEEKSDDKQSFFEFIVAETDISWKLVSKVIGVITAISVLSTYIFEYTKMRYFNISEKYIQVDTMMFITQIAVATVLVLIFCLICASGFGMQRGYSKLYKNLMGCIAVDENLLFIFDEIIFFLLLLLMTKLGNMGVGDNFVVFLGLAEATYLGVIFLNILIREATSTKMVGKHTMMYIVSVIVIMFNFGDENYEFIVKTAVLIGFAAYSIYCALKIVDFYSKGSDNAQKGVLQNVKRLIKYIIAPITIVVCLKITNKENQILLNIIFGIILISYIHTLKKLNIKNLIKNLDINFLKLGLLKVVLVYLEVLLVVVFVYVTSNLFNINENSNITSTLLLALDGIGYYYNDSDLIFENLDRAFTLYITGSAMLIGVIFVFIYSKYTIGEIDIKKLKKFNIISKCSIAAALIFMFFLRIIYCNMVVKENTYFDTITLADARAKIEIQDDSYYYNYSYTSEGEHGDVQVKDNINGFVVLHRYGNDFFIAPYYQSGKSKWDVTIDINKTLTIYSYGVNIKNTVFNSVEIQELEIDRQR